jgi:hypothetical protein
MSRPLCPSPAPPPSTTYKKKPNPPPYTRTCRPPSAARTASRRAPTPASSSPAVRSTLLPTRLDWLEESIRGRVPRQDLQSSTMSLSPGIARPIIYSRVCSQASCCLGSLGRQCQQRPRASQQPTRRDALARWPERIGHATRAKLPLGETDNYAVASALEASPLLCPELRGEAGRWERGSGWEGARRRGARVRWSPPVDRGF